MLSLVDTLLLRILSKQWATTPFAPPPPTFGFDPPDDDWKTRVSNAKSSSLNLYLYEIRENTAFRRSSWDLVDGPGVTPVLSRPPVYVDCHYIISAWSKQARNSESTKPVTEEHHMLAHALRVLLRNPDIVPAQVPPLDENDRLEDSVVFLEGHVYLALTAPEGSRVLNDFWSTMKQPWRPAIQLVVTAPLDLLDDVADDATPMVTLVRTYMRTPAEDDGALIQEYIDIGGWVVDGNDKPIAGADVLHEASGQRAGTNGLGRFVLSGLARGTHRLRISAANHPTLVQDIALPDAPLDQHTFKLT